jgi:hypothetical protein
MPPLDEWLSLQADNVFPFHNGIPYPRRYLNVSDYLNVNVHPHVEKGAIIQGDGFLTDHGPRHISTVIRRAGDLLRHPHGSYPNLKPYEVYLLLVAAHLHDVGNIYGREGHETKLADIITHLNSLLGTDSVERRAVAKIASAHGGKRNGSKDTIDELPSIDGLLGEDVRYQALAALLRFADELSDDSHRAASTLAALGVIPRESEVYHAYAAALHTVQVRPEERVVLLRFQFLKRDATRTYGKRNENVYLLDEIYKRTLKMHFERQYCMRFTHGLVRIDAIDVRIDVYSDANSLSPCIEPIGYRLRDRGYPAITAVSIKDYCPEITTTGDSLNRSLT